MEKPIIVWFRQDLRLSDNPAIYHAAKTGRPLLFLYIDTSEEEHPWEMGSASRWWLHHSLIALQEDLKKHGAHLVLQKGHPLKILKALFKETEASELYFNFRNEPFCEEPSILKEFPARGFHGSLLFEPGTILTGAGEHYQVFTPFYNTCLKQTLPPPFPIPLLKPYHKTLKSLPLKELKLIPSTPWYKGFEAVWEPGERSAFLKARSFLKNRANHYQKARDFPFEEGTSRLSPHLHFGEIGPRSIWKMGEGHNPFLRQIVWREFAYHLLHFHPKTPLHPLKEKFADFPWEKNKRLLTLWQKGKTGFPIIDAGMQELWQTGWMHNRVRMIVGSFLVKDLHLSWVEGAKWFWDTLVDADLANNTFGWQWVGGCGADAAPYFRIFNPVLQAKKFDPDGEYVKKYLPQLKNLNPKWIHTPHLAPEEECRRAHLVMGKDYPYPIVDHDEERKKSLKMYDAIK